MANDTRMANRIIDFFILFVLMKNVLKNYDYKESRAIIINTAITHISSDVNFFILFGGWGEEIYFTNSHIGYFLISTDATHVPGSSMNGNL